MTSIRNIFDRKTKDHSARQRVRNWAIAVLGDEPPTTLTISEIDCGDPSCPGLETIILIMREGEATQAIKIRKPLDTISEQDVCEALRYL